MQVHAYAGTYVCRYGTYVCRYVRTVRTEKLALHLIGSLMVRINIAKFTVQLPGLYTNTGIIWHSHGHQGPLAMIKCLPFSAKNCQSLGHQYTVYTHCTYVRVYTYCTYVRVYTYWTYVRVYTYCTYVRVYTYWTYVRVYTYWTYVRVYTYWTYVRVYTYCTYVRVYTYCTYVRVYTYCTYVCIHDKLFC